MNTLLNRISVVASQLQQEGKSPSLALVRARLGGGISAAELFSAYQSWRAQGCPLQKVADAELTITEPIPAKVQDDLRADIARLESKLDLILQLLQDKA